MNELRKDSVSTAFGRPIPELDQTPGEIVILYSSELVLSSLAAAYDGISGSFPNVRLGHYPNLKTDASVDAYVETIISAAKLVIISLHGGIRYWQYGVERIEAVCQEKGIKLALLDGDATPEEMSLRRSTIPMDEAHRLWTYTFHGGRENLTGLLQYAASLIGYDVPWTEPRPLPRVGLYWPDGSLPTVRQLREKWVSGAPVAAVTFYRTYLQNGHTNGIDALIEALAERGLNPLPIFLTSLREADGFSAVKSYVDEVEPSIIVNTTAFALSAPGGDRVATPYDTADCPLLQVNFSSQSEAEWEDRLAGLSPIDLTMKVALPEVDGRLISCAVAFRSPERYHKATQYPITGEVARADRIAFAADLAANWVRLRETPIADRRVAIVLTNQPPLDSRIGNAVGMDTPAALVNVLRALASKGYSVADIPDDGAGLIARILDGPTNETQQGRSVTEVLPLSTYRIFLESVSPNARQMVLERWGRPEDDPFFQSDLCNGGGFAIPGLRFGNISLVLQPARGYDLDPEASYHSPDLPPPHGYLAAYAWLRHHEAFGAHAAVHMGKHGTLEWLPGKAVALSSDCFPEFVLGPIPFVYPFLVNDPGEGTQAKRRNAACIVDHLTPPMTRAESYGPLADLERLLDEYFEAEARDPRRLAPLKEQILELAALTSLDKDCGVTEDDTPEVAFAKLDTQLCEFKETQIRNGLHTFGSAPEGVALDEFLVAMTRVPRDRGEDGDASILRALAADLALGEKFDPLDVDMGAAWAGPRPPVLSTAGSWRTNGDTIERLELLALDLISGRQVVEPGWTRTQAVLDAVDADLRPKVRSCGEQEISGLLSGLAGRFVKPGSSGAPTRGRLDVLPTGRNFYSVDPRSLPTPSAWTLGQTSARLLVERHREEHGDWPRTLAVSAWGTSNMRTGGDDVAQILALMGAKPTWAPGSGAVTGFEIIPLDELERPRVDVTLRCSGFFRDAFPTQIDLIDAAGRAIAELSEPEDMNPIATRTRNETEALVAEGADAIEARRRAGFRIFGSQPGAYGAGIDKVIEGSNWETEDDLAKVFTNWSCYAYGSDADGVAEPQLFQRRLSEVEIVLHNIDNREHDILDNDDYFQFQGGLTVSVKTLSGQSPAVYIGDTSRPERPRMYSLDEEVARVVRTRVVNPKWIESIMRHGYKGAFEMAATVDYMFGYAATTGAVKDHHFDAVFSAYVEDDQVREFIAEVNPNALRDMARRLIEAIDRGLWQPRSNSAMFQLRGFIED